MPVALTTEKFIALAKLEHGSEYDYSKTIYKGHREKITIICPEHGEFVQPADIHLSGPGCRQTTKTQPNSHVQKYEGKKFIRKAIDKYGNLFDYSIVIYIDADTRVTLKCSIHGNFTQTPKQHLSANGKYPCIECYYDSRKFSTEEFIREAIKKHGSKYDYSLVKYNNTKTSITIMCKIHGCFEQLPKYHLKGTPCYKCKSPNHSQISINWLDNIAYTNGIHIQHAENGGEFCIPNSSYKADGYCAATNTIYEYNGCYYHYCLQCYKPEDTNTLTGVTFKDGYEKTVKKEQFIKSQGFNLVSMWGHDWPKKKAIPQNDIEPKTPKIKIILKNQPSVIVSPIN